MAQVQGLSDGVDRRKGMDMEQCVVVGGAVSRECEWMTYYYSRNGFCLPFLTCPRCMFCGIIDVVASKSAQWILHVKESIFSALYIAVLLVRARVLIHAVYSYRPAITVHICYTQFAFMLYRYYYNYNTLYSKKSTFYSCKKTLTIQRYILSFSKNIAKTY